MGLNLPQPCLCLVTDRKVGDQRTMIERIGEAVAGGVDVVQLREKDLPGSDLLRLADSIKRTIKGRALLIINERADVAVAAAADGVQLGEEALPVAPVRRIVGPQALIGRSVHSPDGALRAQAEGASFLVVGTMYATGSHPDANPCGPGLIRQISQLLEQHSTPLPLIGIGGITAANLGEVIEAGASGVAVIGSILASPDPRSAAQELKMAMIDAYPGRLTLLSGEAKGGALGA